MLKRHDLQSLMYSEGYGQLKGELNLKGIL